MSEIAIKKRITQRKSIRQQPTDISSDEDTPNHAALKDIKLEQSLRVKKGGASVDMLSKTSRGTAAGNSSSSGQTSTAVNAQVGSGSIDTVLGSQFSAEASYGEEGVAHEKLMEQFVNDKLGLNQQYVKL